MSSNQRTGDALALDLCSCVLAALLFEALSKVLLGGAEPRWLWLSTLMLAVSGVICVLFVALLWPARLLSRKAAAALGPTLALLFLALVFPRGAPGSVGVFKHIAVPVLAALCVGGLFTLTTWEDRPRLMRVGERLAWLVAVGSTALNVLWQPVRFPAVHLVLWALALGAGVLAVRARLTTWLLPRLSSRLWLGGVFALALALVVGGLWPLRTVTYDRWLALTLSAPRALPFVRRLPSRAVQNPLVERLKRMRTAPLPTQTDASMSSALPPNFNIVLVAVRGLPAAAVRTRSSQAPQPRAADPAPASSALSQLAERSFNFKHAYAPSPAEGDALRALLYSRDGTLGAFQPGRPLAARMAELGRVPVALVSERLARAEGHLGLLTGYAELATMPQALPKFHAQIAYDLLARVKDKPFFAFVEIDALVNTEGAAKAPRGSAEPLLTVDHALKGILGALADHQVRERTLIVLAGYCARDPQRKRSSSLRDEQVEVPLLIQWPELDGGVISQATVGLIDVVPTVLDWLGAVPPSTLRGQSLTPLLADPRAPWEGRYVLSMKEPERMAIVVKRDKHVFEPAQLKHRHYALARTPDEKRDSFDPLQPGHRELLAELVLRRPAAFRHELGTPEAVAALDRALLRIDPALPAEDFAPLLELVRQAPRPKRLELAAAWFKSTSSDTLRALLLGTLYDGDPERFEGLLSGRLKEVEGTPAERAWVLALAEVTFPKRAQSLLLKAFGEASHRPDAPHAAWLQLIAKQGGHGAKYARDIANIIGILTNASVETRDAAALHTALALLANAKGLPKRSGIGVGLAMRLLDDPHPTLQAAACRVLGHVAAEPAILRQELQKDSFEVRAAALTALVEMLGSGAEADVLQMGKETGYAALAVSLLGRIGTPTAVPFLTWTMEHAEVPETRVLARKAKERIEKQRAAPAKQS